jgi:type II secretory pathway pseudopilin PulG
MGKPIQNSPKTQTAFTRLELAVVIACIFLLGLVTFPLLGRSRSAASEAVCMNNLRNLGRCFLMYADSSNGYVPDEGNTGTTLINAANNTAWYNVAVQPQYPSLKTIYAANNPSIVPLPGNGSVYSCPNSPGPIRLPSVTWAFFMYGENNWLCVNSSTRTTFGQTVQTRFSTIPKPASTIMIGENIDNDISLPAYSGVTAPYTAVRHEQFSQFTMCDGSVRAFRTNEFNHPQSSAAQEWYINGSNPGSGYTSWPCYWWPTPTTLQ